MLEKEDIEEFKKLYFKNYKIQLSDEEATYRANNLVALYTAVYGSDYGVVDSNNKNLKNK